MEFSSPSSPICANWSPGSTNCEKKGTEACANCRLVLYCGKSCQQAHWPKHELDCKCPMSKDDWRPDWERTYRQPPWATGAASRDLHNPYGGNKYLWGNSPAFDMLNLENNEGLGYQDDIALLFAASGDIRHVVKTIVKLPAGISQPIAITINDRDFDVVARNIILLFLALTADDPGDSSEVISRSEVVDTLIHFWYSAFIPAKALERLHMKVKPLIDEVCDKVAAKSPKHVMLERSWRLPSGSSLNLRLTVEYWLQLRAYLEVPEELTLENATSIRKVVTLAPARGDYRDRWSFKEACPFLRVAKRKFREDGILLPFGYPRTAFTIPNPTLFSSGSWPMNDTADPAAGWDVMDVMRTPWPAKWDIYGKLYKHAYENIEIFLDRLQYKVVNFDLHHLDVEDLPSQLQKDRYTRIEASNICDRGYVGIRRTLCLLSPLLQPADKNPHATYIATLINAIQEAIMMGNREDEKPNIELLVKYLPFDNLHSLLDDTNADAVRVWDARSLALDMNMFFDRYMTPSHCRQMSADFGVELKNSNTIVDKWPTQLKLREGDEGAKEEFRLRLGSSVTASQCCIEWKRAMPRESKPELSDGMTVLGWDGVVKFSQRLRAIR